MSTPQHPQVATLGIDIGKNSFHLIGLDACGAFVLRRSVAKFEYSHFRYHFGAVACSLSG
jgi:hypothetical protein